jgi:hypothetical protein
MNRSNNARYYWVGDCRHCGERVRCMMSGGVRQYCSNECRDAARREQWRRANQKTGAARSERYRLRKRLEQLNARLAELDE